MGNSWFQFQQFTIRQGRASMKVCTDSCLFGAFIPVESVARILDIGAGTGLLGLMAAQRNLKAEIHFLEPDQESFLDLIENIENSPWSDRCFAHKDRVEDWIEKNPGTRFDLVICNPPFFINHLKSPDKSRNASLHLDEAEWKIWAAAFSKLVGPQGQLWLLLPGNGHQMMFEALQENRLQILEETIINQNGKPFRTFACFAHQKSERIKKAHLVMRNPEGQLSKWALELMKDYYLLPATPSPKS